MCSVRVRRRSIHTHTHFLKLLTHTTRVPANTPRVPFVIALRPLFVVLSLSTFLLPSVRSTFPGSWTFSIQTYDILEPVLGGLWACKVSYVLMVIHDFVHVDSYRLHKQKEKSSKCSHRKKPRSPFLACASHDRSRARHSTRELVRRCRRLF